jgi:hypothetical protein
MIVVSCIGFLAGENGSNKGACIYSLGYGQQWLSTTRRGNWLCYVLVPVIFIIDGRAMF